MVQISSLAESMIEDDAWTILKHLPEEELRPTLMPDGGLERNGFGFTAEERVLVRDLLKPQ